MNLLVIGSINKDIVNYVARFPKQGETILAKAQEQFHGGKGANQAVACARLGQDIKISFFGKVGRDQWGQAEIDNLKKEGINVEYINVSSKNTGVAFITVSQQEQDNHIIVARGANEDFALGDFAHLHAAIKSHDAILMQLETNTQLVGEAIAIAHRQNKQIFLNPAPALEFKSEWMQHIDWLIPNEMELAEITNKKCQQLDDIIKEGIKLIDQGLKNLIVTLGKNGCLYINNVKKVKHFKTKMIDPIDTTAAGDTFIGAFVTNVAPMGVEQAIQFAMQAATITILNKGAQISIPTRKEVLNEKNSIIK